MKKTMRLFTFIATTLFGHASEGEKVNLPAPQVSGVNQDGKTVPFADIYAKGPTVVFFYPKANTPGCTKQACSLRDAFSDLTKEGVQILGVSLDSTEAQKKFQTDHKLPYDLIADTEGKIVDAFGVKKMGMGVLPLAARSCFLVKNGQIIWKDAAASTAKQAEDIKRVLAETK
jgi:thioredoxin-dependent peroxiredoxin